MHLPCPINGTTSIQKNLLIQFLFYWKTHHCSFKKFLTCMLFKAYLLELLHSVSCSSLSFFFKSFLHSLQFLLALYQVDSAQAINHFQLTALFFCFFSFFLFFFFDNIFFLFKIIYNREAYFIN